jgi:glycosyltransferase involved in cell wall biosynthesis
VKKIVFVFSGWSSFVKKDIFNLGKFFTVLLFPVNLHLRFWRCLKSVMMLFNAVLFCDAVFVWFGGVNAFYSVLFAKLLRKKSVVVVGGVDAQGFGNLNYGHFSRLFSRVVACFVYRFVDAVVPVDQSLADNLNGFLHFNVKNKTFVVPTCYDHSFWKPDGKKENMVLTVVSNINVGTFFRKGLFTFFQIAKKYPKVKFVVAGKVSPEMTFAIRYVFPEVNNVEMVGFVSKYKLLELYQKAKVYCQFSLVEGFPNGLCEAMLCECVPVGTARGGIPTAIGNSGYYVEFGDAVDSGRAVGCALVDCEKGTFARYRIMSRFPLKKRKFALKNIINNVMKKG